MVLKTMLKVRIVLQSILIALLLSSLISCVVAENNGTIKVRIGDQFTIDSWEHSFEYDNEYLSMIVNSNGTETFTTLKTGNTTIIHKVYPKGDINVYNVSIRELTFTEYVSKIVDDFFNSLNR